MVAFIGRAILFPLNSGSEIRSAILAGLLRQLPPVSRKLPMKLPDL